MFNPIPPRDETERDVSPEELAEQEYFERTHPDYVLLKLTCEQCGKLFRVKCNAAGEKVDCPACEHTHIIPDAFPDNAGSASSWPVNGISLLVFCPRCEKKCLVKGEQAGKRIRCNNPSCRKIFRVPPIPKNPAQRSRKKLWPWLLAGTAILTCCVLPSGLAGVAAYWMFGGSAYWVETGGNFGNSRTIIVFWEERKGSTDGARVLLGNGKEVSRADFGLVAGNASDFVKHKYYTYAVFVIPRDVEPTNIRIGLQRRGLTRADSRLASEFWRIMRPGQQTP